MEEIRTETETVMSGATEQKCKFWVFLIFRFGYKLQIKHLPDEVKKEDIYPLVSSFGAVVTVDIGISWFCNKRMKITCAQIKCWWI